jgi:hypothetical protein
MQETFTARNDLGHWVRGTSGNRCGRPKPPDGLRTRLAELSPLMTTDPYADAVEVESAQGVLGVMPWASFPARHAGKPPIVKYPWYHLPDGCSLGS